MTQAPTNPWIMTASGMAFDLIAPTAEMVRWSDVAEALAKIPRFGAHTPGVHYSVAQHSVLVARLVPPEFAPHALLHDAHEAWLGDTPTPLKAAIAIICAWRAESCRRKQFMDMTAELRAVMGGEDSRAFRAIHPILERYRQHGPNFAEAVKEGLELLRSQADHAVWSAASLPPPSDACRRAIKHADLVALSTERRDLMPKGLDADWDFPLPPPDSARIKPLPWPKAQALFETELARLFPHLQLRSAA